MRGLFNSINYKTIKDICEKLQGIGFESNGNEILHKKTRRNENVTTSQKS